MKNWVLGRMLFEEAVGDDGAQGGGAGGTGGADTAAGADNGASSATDGGKADNNAGALAGARAAAEPVDYSKMSDEDYMKQVKVPDGLDFDGASFSKAYGAFMRENKISPEVVSKFLEIEGAAAANEAKEEAARVEAEQKAFKEEGAALVKQFNPEQIASAIKALKDVGAADEAFMKMATGRFSNNATLVKLLVNWGETHKVDTLPGAANGSAGKDDFATLWMGSK